MSAGELVVPIGPPGAGKSTFTAARFTEAQRLSLDRFRGMCTDDEHDQSATTAAVELRARVLLERLRRGLVCVADSTNARESHRKDLLTVARRFNRPAVAVLFHTPLAECIRRRPAPFPSDVVFEMFTDIGRSWSVLSREFDCVVHVSPTGEQLFRVGDPPGWVARPAWLADLPARPSGWSLPWTVEYGY